MADLKFCADYAKELGLDVTPGFLPRECCISCHEDYDEDGYHLLDVYVDGQVEGVVGCDIKSRIEEKRVLRLQPKPIATNGSDLGA